MRDTSLIKVRRVNRPVENNFGYYIAGRKLQFLYFILKNNAGTLQHAYTANGSGTGTPSPLVTDKFRNIVRDSVFTNTPTVGAGTGFAGGAGISTNMIVFDTEPVVPGFPRPMDHVELVFYSGNNTRVRPIAGLQVVNVLGTGVRFVIGLWNAVSGAAVNITTTWLPSGQFAYFQGMFYL